MNLQIPLQTRTLGRTGLQVSQAGLGCGGNSRLGLAYGKDLAHAASVVRSALEMGVTIIDTAHYYQTEPAVGMALKEWPGGRDDLVISTKGPYLDSEGKLLSPADFRQNLEKSLRDLGLETIDIYLIHGLRLPYYEACCETPPAGAGEGEARRKNPLPWGQRGLRERHAPRAAAAPGAGRSLGGGHGRFQPGQPLRPRAGAVGHPCEGHRHAGDVRCAAWADRRGALAATAPAAGRVGRGRSWIAGLRRFDGEPGLEGRLRVALGSRLPLRRLRARAGLHPHRHRQHEHLHQNLREICQGPLPESAQERLAELFGKIDSVSAQLQES